jgi:hypothetical protein
MKKIILIGFIIFFFYVLYKCDSSDSSGPGVGLNGISPNQLASDIMSKYDSNSNDTLDVASESFLRTEIGDVIKVESRGLLFSDADKFGNNDGSVTKLELLNYLQEFDSDGDGEITSENEWDEFDKKYGEKFKYN